MTVARVADQRFTQVGEASAARALDIRRRAVLASWIVGPLMISAAFSFAIADLWVLVPPLFVGGILLTGLCGGWSALLTALEYGILLGVPMEEWDVMSDPEPIVQEF